MDLESQNTIARLSAQVNMNVEDSQFEMNEEVAETQAHERSETQTTQAASSHRKRRKTSPVWADFELVGIEQYGKERAKCIHCGTKLVVNSKTHGTNHLKRHLDTCSKMPKKGDRVEYDQSVDREMTSEIIIFHDLPFRYVEYEKVRARDKYLNPDCQHICRQTVASDVYKKYELEKEKLIEVLGKHRGRVCFTSDLWTSRPTVMGYICLTAHFVDDSWILHSKILAFCEMKSPHTGQEMANKILECLREWSLEKKVFSLTLNNATNNNSMLDILKGQLQMMSDTRLLCDGDFMHVRCCAHILNLIVKEGLELAKDVLHNIRESVKYVKASQSRKQAFAVCVEKAGIKSAAGLSLDVPTRWNSTYEMLVRALKFRKAFAHMDVYDKYYVSLPTEEEWNRGEMICDFLKPFSVITTYFSGSKYPTSNVYFTQVWRIQMLLKKYVICDDDEVRRMACDMQVKFDKYWEDYSLILAMGVVLDPRLKIQMLERAYETVDHTTSEKKIDQLKKSMIALYEDYQAKSMASSSCARATPTPQELVNEFSLEDDFENDLFELERSIEVGSSTTKTQLDIYLDEPRLERKSFPDLDVLGYWKDNQHRLGDLAFMARDLLSIPITTIALEYAFSIGARVLTQYRNRLLPKNVQALICTRNWLRGFPDYEGTIEKIEDTTIEVEGSRSECSNMS